MKKKLLTLIIVLLSFHVSSFNQTIEFESVLGLNLPNANIKTMMSLVDMDYSNFETLMTNHEFVKVGYEDDMVLYRAGSYSKSGIYDIRKSQYRSMITISWFAIDQKSIIFDNLRRELSPFFMEIIDYGYMVFHFEINNRLYQFAYKRRMGSEHLIIGRLQ